MANEGSFSRAARRLNISQPTLSQQIKTLENRYHAMLFEGRRRPLQLTPIGHKLQLLTRQLFATSEEIEELLGDRPASQPPAVRLASDSPIYAARLAEVLLRTSPELSVEVHIHNSRDTLAQLLEAKADVAIISDPPIAPRFAYKPLFTDRLKVLVPVGHALAEEKVYPLAAFADDCLLVREPSSKTRGATEALLSEHGLRPPRTIELHSREALREAVALGLGISLFFSAECPFDSRIMVLDLECQPDAALLTGYIVCCAEQRRSGLMRRVLEAAESLEALSPVPLEHLANKSGQTVPKAYLQTRVAGAR